MSAKTKPPELVRSKFYQIRVTDSDKDRITRLSGQDRGLVSRTLYKTLKRILDKSDSRE